MKNILILIFIASFLASCQNKENKENKTDESRNIEETQTSETTSTTTEENDAFDISVVNNEDIDMYGGIALENEEGIFLYIHEKKKLGKMIINGNSYKITKMNTNDGVYVFEGDGIEVSTSKCNFKPIESDCAYGTCDKSTIRFKEQVREYNTVKIQDCSSAGM